MLASPMLEKEKYIIRKKEEASLIRIRSCRMPRLSFHPLGLLGTEQGTGVWCLVHENEQSVFVNTFIEALTCTFMGHIHVHVQVPHGWWWGICWSQLYGGKRGHSSGRSFFNLAILFGYRAHPC